MKKDKTFSDNLKYYVERSGRTQKEIAEAIGVTSASLSRYVNGIDYPRMDKVQKLADYFGILKSDLIEDGEEKEKENRVVSDMIVKMNTNEDFYQIIEMLHGCDDARLKRMLAYLNLVNKDLKN